MFCYYYHNPLFFLLKDIKTLDPLFLLLYGFNTSPQKGIKSNQKENIMTAEIINFHTARKASAKTARVAKPARKASAKTARVVSLPEQPRPSVPFIRSSNFNEIMGKDNQPSLAL